MSITLGAYAPHLTGTSAPQQCLTALIMSLDARDDVETVLIKETNSCVTGALSSHRWLTVPSRIGRRERAIDAAAIDCVLSYRLDPIQPVLLSTPAILWCHGDEHWELPAVIGRTQSYVTRALEIALLPQYDHVACVSDDLARRIDSRYRGLVPTTTVHNGIRSVFEPTQNTAVLDRCGIESPYILHVGRAAPEKNGRTMVQAFADIHREHPDTTLVLRGGDPQVADMRNAITTVGWLNERELASLYTHAAVVVVPSLYESFGLPALEAMTCGTAVVAANVYALPEVCAEAGVAVDPQSSAIAVACNRLLDDDDLRAEYERRGRARAAAFSWDRAASTMVAVCRDIA